MLVIKSYNLGNISGLVRYCVAYVRQVGSISRRLSIRRDFVDVSSFSKLPSSKQALQGRKSFPHGALTTVCSMSLYFFNE